MTRDARFVANDLRSLLHEYTQTLEERAREIDLINVFPVADADTGSNLLGTMRVVADAIRGVEDDMAVLARAIGRSALRGAQGNSGVILSQWLRGFTGHLGANGEVGPSVLAAALTQASDVAYAAVDAPREGTMLSIARRAAEEASAVVDTAHTIRDVWKAASRAGDAALLETTSQMEILHRYNVVDSGAYGLAILFDVGGGRSVVRPDASGRACEIVAGSQHPTRPVPESGWYEVMFLLDAPGGTDGTLAELRAAWREIGESIDISGDEGTWVCHVHTPDIGAALEAAIRVGQPHDIHVTAVPAPEEPPALPAPADAPDAR